MEIERGLQIARREWASIRVSFERCGDIGEFGSKSHLNNRLVLIEMGNKFPTYEYFIEGSLLLRNLIEMDNKLPKYGYLTPEAAYVFSTLAPRAAERLGLEGRLAQTFGSGYSWVRTGWVYPSGLPGGLEEQIITQQLFFFKIFFPLGGYFNWDFNSHVVKTKLDLYESYSKIWIFI